MDALDGVSDGLVQERRERRAARHIHREWVNGVRDHVPQWNRGERRGEDHLLVFTARSWGVVVLLFVVGGAVLEEVGGRGGREKEQLE